jgi:Tol biopolymer transport system component
MSLSPGESLGSYHIVSALGAGGMGEVYRARDPRLDREVAIKVLPAALASDVTALARFEREAMSVARLSHPNVLSIYEFAKADGVAFVVMELVDGETLRARLAAGALSARKAIAYALQIARGIAAAHARGIVHRDLKPENVMITRDDHVKILDFGLAKSIESGDAEQTRAAGLATSAGTVLGTFGYMAPEQVRAQPVDHRADMFAIGAVLYEMLTGARAFAGETAADTMSAILTKEPPDLDTVRLSIPPGLDRIVRRCLEKTPDLRFQSATDLAFALESLTAGSTPSGATTIAPPPVAPRARIASLPWAIAAVAVIAAAAVLMTRGGAVAPESHWTAFTRITEMAGEETSPSLSPDGNTVIYTARADGSWNIYTQRVGGRNATAILSDPQRDERGPTFSPDGSSIAFHESDADGGIFVAGATGESVRRVTDAGFDPAWSPDGKFIAYATEEVNDPSSRKGGSSLYVVAASGGTPRKIADVDDGVQPSWSSSGDRLVYWSNIGGRRDIVTIAVSGGARAAVTSDAAIDWAPVWSPDGRYVYFSSDRGGAMNLWRIAVNQSTGAVEGTPEPVTAGVQAAIGLPQFSRDGSRLVFRSRVGSTNPVAIPFDPTTLRAGTPVLLDSRTNIRIPSDVSADGKLIAFFNIGERQEDLHVGPPEGPMRRVTDDADRDRGPMFMPDGRSLVFYSTRGGNWGMWTIGIDGGNLRLLPGLSKGAVYPLVAPEGDRIVVTSDAGRGAILLPLNPKAGEAAVLEGTEIGELGFSPTAWSQDGARLVGTLSLASGRPAGVAVYDLAAKKAVQVSSDETAWVRWLPDGRRVIYFAKSGWELVVVDTVTQARTHIDVTLAAPSVDDTFAMRSDGRTIYYGAQRSEADIWIVDRK